MFKRRKSLTIWQKIRELFWPSMGWVRATHYAKHRIVRLSSTTHNITTGLVCGMCISFTPFFGFHFILAALYARVLGGNMLASIVGTFFGNPWTFPFLFWASFETGKFLLRMLGFEDLVHQAGAPDIEQIQSNIWTFIQNNFWDLYIPTALGGTVCALLFWPIFYGPVYLFVRSAQAARHKHLQRKWKKKWQNAAGHIVQDDHKEPKE